MSEPQLLTPAAFKAWHAANAAQLREADERNQQAVADCMIRAVMNSIQSGATLEEAGDAILRAGVGYGFRGGVLYTRDGYRRALLSIGWRPKRERTGATAE
jgi:NurA-like 5'-3' nuclease